MRASIGRARVLRSIARFSVPAAPACARLVCVCVLLALRAASAAATEAQPPFAAFFTARSYRPGQTAVLVVLGSARRLSVTIVHAGNGSMRPLAAARVASLGPLKGPKGRTRVDVRVGRWPSGLYFVRLTALAGRAAYAPFVVRSRPLGRSRIAVVLPTNTWQAYNFWAGDSWYADPAVRNIDLDRPYLGNGLPPHFRAYDLGFLRWFASTGRRADFLSDDDLEWFGTGAQLRRLYTLIVFPGHEEYVTEHVFDVILRYRDLGGDLAFLSSNNFFYKVIRVGHAVEGRWRWRDLGRPEAQLTGAQYLDWNHDAFPNRPYVVTGARRAPWLFRGTGLRNGDRIPGRFGIEIDAVTTASPPGTIALATIPNLFGPGKSAEMTFYRTPRGAEVFDSGTINFGGAAAEPVVGRMLDNLWRRLARPR